MSYTNTTPNYALPQYVADDKPTYLGDFNKAMLDIDTAIKTNDTKASSAESTANTANANASQALETATNAEITAQNADTNATQAKTLVDNLTTRVSNAETDASTAKTTANTANTTAQSAAQLANVANSTAEVAKTTADEVLNKLDGTVLFDDPTGKKFNQVSLSETIQNFSFIEIEFGLVYSTGNYIKSTGRIPVTPTTYFLCDLIRPTSEFTQIFGEDYSISSTSIESISANHFLLNNNGSIGNISQTNELYFLKIIGY